MRFVTVTIGGNDVFGPVVKRAFRFPDPIRGDQRESLAAFQVNLDYPPRVAGGRRPDTTFVATAYANPLIGRGVGWRRFPA